MSKSSENSYPLVSVVVPVFNEAKIINQNLSKMLAQDYPNYELLVVDNGSTDSTPKILLGIENIKILKSANGLINARNKGFEEAKGDILVRVDADLEVGPKWLGQLVAPIIDRGFAATSGAAVMRSSPLLPKTRSYFWSRTYLKNFSKYLGTPILWGTQMALTKKSYLDIADKLSKIENLHEDQDISIVLGYMQYRVLNDLRLDCFTDGKDHIYDFPKFVKYVELYKNAHTKAIKLGVIKNKYLNYIRHLPIAPLMIVWTILCFVFYHFHRLFGLNPGRK